MKVLLTGSTAQQISPAVHERIPTFAGLVYKALVGQGVEVVWVEPHMEMDENFVDLFDLVIVGLVSPGSLAANYIYPALSVAQVAADKGKLVILTDSPEPHKLWAGIQSAVQNEGSLVKDFYARRRDFKAALEPKTYQRLHGFLGALLSVEWPLTLAPRLPWTSELFLSRHIPTLTPERTLGMMFDKGMDLPLASTIIEPEERRTWVADTPTSAWTMQVASTIALPIEPIRTERRDTSADLASRLCGSVGTLVTTYRGREPWWTPVVLLSLLQRTPVVSDWRHTSVLGASWSNLASYVEGLTFDERRDLALGQHAAYEQAVPEFLTESSRLLHALVSIISP